MPCQELKTFQHLRYCAEQIKAFSTNSFCERIEMKIHPIYFLNACSLSYFEQVIHGSFNF